MPDSAGPQRLWPPRPVHLPRGAQKEADRRIGELLIPLLDQGAKADVEALIAQGKVILAVRRARELTGMRLIDARRVVDSLRR